MVPRFDLSNHEDRLRWGRFWVRGSTGGLTEEQVERAAQLMADGVQPREDGSFDVNVPAWHAVAQVTGTPCNCAQCRAAWTATRIA